MRDRTRFVVLTVCVVTLLLGGWMLYLSPAWLSQGVTATGYSFTALFFWMFCFTFSRYSLRLEKKMGAYRAQQGL